MIEQVVLHGADASRTTAGASAFGWEDLVEAMTTRRGGHRGRRRVHRRRRRARSRSTRPGHAVAAPRLHEGRRVDAGSRSACAAARSATTRRCEKEERFSRWRSEEFGPARLGPRRDGRGAGLLRRELERRRRRRPVRHGAGGAGWSAPSGMAPRPIELNARLRRRERRGDAQADHEALRARSAAGSSTARATTSDAVARPREARLAAQFLGASVRDRLQPRPREQGQVERIANAVIEKQEIFGDELVRLLDAQNLRQPELDWTEEETWPTI